MKGKSICKECGIEFEWKRAKKQTHPMYCSMKCRGHSGFRPGGNFRISEATEQQKRERLLKSFEKHVVRKEGCWDWSGTLDKGGYPVMSCRRGIGPDRGHKASFLIHKGPIEKGKHICHSCDNRKCTNPDHLWIRTHKENNDDKIEKGRANWVKPPHKPGSENGASKLNEEQVKEIKILLKKGLTSRDIGKQYGVSKTTILRIKKGKNWSHVTFEETNA